MHFTAAQEAFGRIDDAVHQGAIRFRLALVELELPVEMTTLPSRCVQARHHALGETVHGDLIDPLRQPLAPVASVFLKGGLHGPTFHGMTAVVAVADAVGTLDCAETHGEHKIQLSNSQGFSATPAFFRKVPGHQEATF